jgi:hypothetical protein
MAALDMTVASSVLALIRRDVTASYVADRFGVTEAQVLEMQDLFVIAGVLALAEFQNGGRIFAHLGQDSNSHQQAGAEELGLSQLARPRYGTTLGPGRRASSRKQS